MGVYKNGIWMQNEFNERLLPDGYTQLECIEGDGSSYIDTGYIPDSNMKFQIKASTKGVSGSTGLFGARTSSSTYPILSYIEITWNGNSNVIRIDINSSKDTGERWTIDEPFIIEIDNLKQNTKVNNKAIPNSCGISYSTSCNVTISLFAVHTGTAYQYPIKGKIYYCKIYNKENLVRDFIPAKRNSDDTIGLYDRVNNTFYENAGTGSFTAGPQVGGTTANVKIYKETNALEANEFWEI